MDWAFPGGKPRANVWEGVFPVRDTADDGYAGLAPVGCFDANDFGVYDMVGNVWEWVAGQDAVGLVKGGSFLCAVNYCANFRPAAYRRRSMIYRHRISAFASRIGVSNILNTDV